MDAKEQLLEHALGFVRPVLYARVGNQTWTQGGELVSFTVVLPDGAPLVRVNDEVEFGLYRSLLVLSSRKKRSGPAT